MAVQWYDIFLRVLKNISLYAMTLKMLCAYRLCDIYLCSQWKQLLIGMMVKNVDMVPQVKRRVAVLHQYWFRVTPTAKQTNQAKSSKIAYSECDHQNVFSQLISQFPYFSTWNWASVACVTGVWKERERGFRAREKRGGARGVAPKIPVPFPFASLPLRLELQ